MGSASIGSSSSSSGSLRVFRIFLILLRCSSSAFACISCFTSSLTIACDLMLFTRTGCEPPREVATGPVHSDLTRSAVDVGFHLARREEFIKARVAASSMCCARCGLIPGRSSEPRQWSAHFASRLRYVRRKCRSCQISRFLTREKARNLVRNLFGRSVSASIVSRNSPIRPAIPALRCPDHHDRKAYSPPIPVGGAEEHPSWSDRRSCQIQGHASPR